MNESASVVSPTIGKAYARKKKSRARNARDIPASVESSAARDVKRRMKPPANAPAHSIRPMTNAAPTPARHAAMLASASLSPALSARTFAG